MRFSDGSAARLVTAGVGLTCLASALWFARSPRAAARAVHLPASEGVGRAIAVRDLAIGLLLLVPATQRPGLALRSASDALDAGLMTSELVRGRRSPITGWFIVGALALSGLSSALRAQLSHPPATSRP